MMTKRNVLGLLRSKRFQRQHGIKPPTSRKKIKDPKLLKKLLNWESLEDEPPDK